MCDDQADPAPPEHTIRPATIADAQAIRALTRDAYAKWVQVIGREPLPMTADYQAAVRNHAIDLLLQAGKLVALIEMIARPDHLLVENVAVRPECQGRGFGRLLMRHAEMVAARSGHAEIRLYTNLLFASNIALYRRLGYVTDREAHFPGGGVVVHMSKKL